MKVFVLVIWLLNGEQAYDDTMDGIVCHAYAEALKEGGHISLPGWGDLFVKTAQCVERLEEPV